MLMISYYLGPSIVSSLSMLTTGSAWYTSPKVLLLMRCPLYYALTHGDGVAHTRAREARINIMLIMRIRNRLKTIG